MWTEKRLQQLKDTGMIKGFNSSTKGNSPGSKLYPRPSKEKEWISMNLLYWCNEKSVELKSELRFDQDRKWRFDWAIPALKIAIEYEGLNSEKSRHTTKRGFTADTDKYNRAQVLGWKVIRVTALNYKSLLQTLKTIYE